MNGVWHAGPLRVGLFHDRADAGRHLAERLRGYREHNTLVLGIPRGGVPVAAAVAAALDADLDIVVARKLGSPISAELAIGAVTANGGRFLNEDLIRELKVSPAYVEAESEEQTAEARRREWRLREPYPMSRVAGRNVIVVDDGLATGATMIAAVRSVRAHQPARLVVAVPVGSSEACAALSQEADEVVCLYQPTPFWAVGIYYEQFQPTTDEEVRALLQASYARRRQPQRQAG
jgi:putative phosphoribosyl transferase